MCLEGLALCAEIGIEEYFIDQITQLCAEVGGGAERGKTKAGEVLQGPRSGVAL